MARQLPRPRRPSIIRLATLAPQGGIQVEQVKAEIERLKWLWSEEPFSDGLLHKRPSEKHKTTPIKSIGVHWIYSTSLQLQHVIDECRKHPNMATAGRALFNVSRTERAKVNDSDRLRKYLQRFGLEWEIFK